MHEEVDILYVLISLNKYSSMQVLVCSVGYHSNEAHIKSGQRPETKMPRLTPKLVVKPTNLTL